jgi:glycosyltransferase involved in cell wall biosynthesis
MSQPLFSIIIPTYGRAEFLAEAVDSVLIQTVRDFECLVIDDGSPEPVSLSSGDDRVRVVRREVNGGPSAARNTGVAHATGRYVTFLDDDDLYLPERLALALQGLARAPVAVCWTAFVGQMPEEGRATGRRLEGDVGATILDGPVPAVGVTALERERTPPFDESLDFLEDVEWWRQLAGSHTVATVPRVGHLYRRHDGVRHRWVPAARPASNVAYLTQHADYFAARPRAAAFRWKRCGLLALEAGQRSLAREAFWRSLRAAPSARTAWHLVRSSLPLRPGGRGPSQATAVKT